MRNYIYTYRFKNLFILGLGLILGELFGQSPSENYIYIQEPTVPVQAVTASTEAIRSVQYFDGLGRPKQSIAIQATPDGKDIVTKIEYDGFGRQVKDYLPAPTQQTNGQFITDPTTAYTSHYGAYPYTTTVYYSEKTFENSPLNRVLAQSAPGDAWAKGSGHEIEFEYQTNSANEVLIYWVDGSGLIKKGNYTGVGNYYPKNALYKTITTDENKNKIYEFKDKQGRVVLKRSSVLEQSEAEKPGPNPTSTLKTVDTYYVYDIYGNLVAVVPPLAAEKSVMNTTIQNNLCYLYSYDHRNRLIEKKLPGKEKEYMVYDKQDRLVATQDQNLKNQGKWLFTKYDKFGRVVYTGSINNAASRENLQTTVNSFENNNESRTTQSFSQNGSTVYYTKTAFPTSFLDVLSVNYYDTYDNLGFTVPSSILGESDLRKLNDQTKGMPVSSYVRVIGTTNWEKTFTVYDKKSQAVGVYKTNHLGGYTETESKLSFRGIPKETQTKHKRNPTGLEVKIKDEFTYDSQLRLTLHTQNLGSSLVKNLIAKNEYDQLGQLITKEVGGTANNATDRWQEINYNYNIRGWLTNINDIRELMAGKGLPPPSPSDDLFSFAIQYNQLIEPGSGDYTSPLYNGNIAQTFWKTGSDNTLRGYNYEYDQLNRLLNAEFYKKETNPYSGAYNEALAYDVNGNIKNLIRTTADANNNPINMDELTYSYQSGNGNSNRLMNVNDAVSTQNTDGFVDGNTSLSLDDYEYDSNGNMILDRNKGIESIHYNHLNLPTRVNFTNNKHISYKYNAAGQKLQKTVNYSDSIKIVDYLDGFQYAGEVLQFFPHTEGYVKVTAISAGRGLPTSDFAFNYVFNYTDHLGNVRLSYTKDPQTGTLDIMDENHYYPFGLKHGIYAAGNLKDFTLNGAIDTPILEQVRKTEYQYKYQGQERQDELGLNWDSFKWRNYDYAIGRFFNIDPLTEKYNTWSPYAFSGNRVVDARELEGLEPYSVHNSMDAAADNWGIYYNDNSIRGYTEYGSTIGSSMDSNGNTVYSYGFADSGTNDGTSVSPAPEGTVPVADIHSHGGFEDGYSNNDFSGLDSENNKLSMTGDIGDNNKTGLTGYVTTPNGSLQKYDPSTGVVSVVNESQPSDPNDPSRLNTIPPTESIPQIDDSLQSINIEKMN